MKEKEKQDNLAINAINDDYFINDNFVNIADKCINYNDDENHHFKPYYFCELCKIQ